MTLLLYITNIYIKIKLLNVIYSVAQTFLSVWEYGNLFGDTDIPDCAEYGNLFGGTDIPVCGNSNTQIFITRNNSFEEVILISGKYSLR